MCSCAIHSAIASRCSLVTAPCFATRRSKSAPACARSPGEHVAPVLDPSDEELGARGRTSDVHEAQPEVPVLEEPQLIVESSDIAERLGADDHVGAASRDVVPAEKQRGELVGVGKRMKVERALLGVDDDALRVDPGGAGRIERCRAADAACAATRGRRRRGMRAMCLERRRLRRCAPPEAGVASRRGRPAPADRRAPGACEAVSSTDAASTTTTTSNSTSSWASALGSACVERSGQRLRVGMTTLTSGSVIAPSRTRASPPRSRRACP